MRAGLSEEEWCNCWIASVDSILRSCQSEGTELTLEAPGAQIVLAMVALYHDSRQLIHGIIKFYSKADRKGQCMLCSRVLVLPNAGSPGSVPTAEPFTPLPLRYQAGSQGAAAVLQSRPS